MKRFKKFALLCGLIFAFPFKITAAEKYALIIAIGDYDTKTGWSKISSANDVPLIKNALLKQSFNESNFTVLMNFYATKSGIENAFKVLINKLKKGDIVVVHYSGHGQQIFDDNGDEVDGLDEALVPVDAWANYNAKYKGENHLRDDEIQKIITGLHPTFLQSFIRKFMRRKEFTFRRIIRYFVFFVMCSNNVKLLKISVH